MPQAVFESNTVNGHIISTTIGGKNGEDKQVRKYRGHSVASFFTIHLISLYYEEKMVN